MKTIAKEIELVNAAPKVVQALSSHTLTLYQYYRPPLDWQAQLAFYRLRAVAGMEWFNTGKDANDNGGSDKAESQSEAAGMTDDMPLVEYGRTLQVGKMRALVQIAHEADLYRFKLTLTLTPESSSDELQAMIAQIRRILDLDADMLMIEQQLQSLSELELPPISGLRIPGAGSLFEAGCRAILGQQVSVVQATKLLNILVDAYGERVSLNGQEYRFFPTPTAIKKASLAELNMPGARKLALNALAAFIDQHPKASVDDWIDIKGIGPWTIAYAKLRGLGEPNIFLHTDLIVKKQLLLRYGKAQGLPPEAIKKLDYPQLCRQLTDAIAPWGSYLTFQLWSQSSLPSLE